MMTEAKTGRAKLKRALYPLFAFAAAILVISIPSEDIVAKVPAGLPPAHRDAMPDFTFPTLDGKTWRLSEHRGHVVLINYWAAWCPPCRAETPDLAAAARQYQTRGVDFVGVSMDNTDLGAVRSFAAEYQVPYPIAIPEPNSPATARIDGYPTTVILDRHGRVARIYTQMLDAATVKRDLDRLAAEP